MSSSTPHHDRVMVLLKKLDRVEDQLDELGGDVRDLLDTELTDEDLVILLWGRKHDRTKGGTRDAIDALQSIGDKDVRDVMIRLVAAYGKMSRADAEEFVDDMYDLRERYGPSGGSP